MLNRQVRDVGGHKLHRSKLDPGRPGPERGKPREMSSSHDQGQDDQKRSSYDDESFETAEESIPADARSSHFAMCRRESVFFAESSSSAEEIQESSVFGQTIDTIGEGYESTPSMIATDSAGKAGAITEEQSYSDQFESIADNLSEEGSFTKVYESIPKTVNPRSHRCHVT